MLNMISWRTSPESVKDLFSVHEVFVNILMWT